MHKSLWRSFCRGFRRGWLQASVGLVCIPLCIVYGVAFLLMKGASLALEFFGALLLRCSED